MRTRTWCVAFALISWISGRAAAQTVLSEADALSRLSDDSPRVRAIRGAVDVARADVLAAARWPNPRLTYNREAVAGVAEHMWLVTQPLPITGRRGLDVSAASALADASARRADDQVRAARAALRTAYADLVAAQVREAEWARSRERLRALADMLARRESEGESAGYDRIRAERETIEMDGEWSNARADRARAQAAVAAFFATPGDVTAITADMTAPPRTVLPGVDELVGRAEQTRGEAAALRQEIESARFAERAAGRRAVPEPEVVAGTKSSNVGGGDIGSVLSVHATMPLFDRGQPERARARARTAVAAANAAAFRAQLLADVSALRAVVLERRDAADRHRASAESAAQLERIAQISYDAGERGILELVDAYRGGAVARARQAALDAATRQAEIELEFVSGWEIR